MSLSAAETDDHKPAEMAGFEFRKGLTSTEVATVKGGWLDMWASWIEAELDHAPVSFLVSSADVQPLFGRVRQSVF